MSAEQTITGKLEQKNEKSNDKGTYYNIKVGTIFLTAFSDAAKAIREVPLGTFLEVTYTTTQKGDRQYHNLQAFKQASPVQERSNNREEKDENIAKSVAANVTAELAKSCPDEVEKHGIIGFFNIVAPEVYKWLRSDGTTHYLVKETKKPTSDHLEATHDSFQSPQ